MTWPWTQTSARANDAKKWADWGASSVVAALGLAAPAYTRARVQRIKPQITQHGSCEQGSPYGAQIPQLGLQHTYPTLHVIMPQGALCCGYSMGLMQLGLLSHSACVCAQIPQSELQHISPTLQVLNPQGWLASTEDIPHTCCEHFSPGLVHVPQLALQHTWPGAHCTWPHCTGGGRAELAGAADALALGCGDGVAAPALG